MRTTLFSLLAVSVIVCGCSRPEAAPRSALAGQSNPDAAPAAAATAAGETPRTAEAAPAWREITVPAGTPLTVTLDTAVGSDISRVEEPVTAHLTHPVHLHGEIVIAEGSRVSGVVTDATRSGKVKGLAHIALRFESITPRGDDHRYAIRTSPVGRTAQSTKQKDALEIGAPAAGGAIIGALVGGKKGALVGTAVGGGAGTAAVLSTRGKEVRLPKGAALSLKLSEPVTIRVRG
jgi:hypothetical protein